MNKIGLEEKMIDTTLGLRNRITITYSIQNSKDEQFMITDKRYYFPLTGKLAKLPQPKLELTLKDEIVTRFYTLDKFDQVIEEFTHLIEGERIKRVDAITGRVLEYERG